MSRLKTTFVYDLLMRLLLGLWYLLSVLPRSWHLRLAQPMGRFCCWVSPRRSRIIDANLALCFPSLAPDARQRLRDDHLYYLGLSLFDTAVAWYWSLASIPQSIPHQFVGLEDFLRVQQRSEQGILLMGMHVQHLELSACLLGTQVDSNGVARSYQAQSLNAATQRGRGRFASEVASSNNPRQFIRWLKNGKTLVYYPDQDYGLKRSVQTTLFGVPATWTTAPYTLYKHSNCLLYLFHTYYVDGVLMLAFEPLSLPCEDALSFTTGLAQAIEQSIAQQPSQYLWAHRRFKSTLGKAYCL